MAWYRESNRHSQAAKGIETNVKAIQHSAKRSGTFNYTTNKYKKLINELQDNVNRLPSLKKDEVYAHINESDNEIFVASNKADLHQILVNHHPNINITLDKLHNKELHFKPIDKWDLKDKLQQLEKQHGKPVNVYK